MNKMFPWMTWSEVSLYVGDGSTVLEPYVFHAAFNKYTLSETKSAVFDDFVDIKPESTLEIKNFLRKEGGKTVWKQDGNTRILGWDNAVISFSKRIYQTYSCVRVSIFTSNEVFLSKIKEELTKVKVIIPKQEFKPVVYTLVGDMNGFSFRSIGVLPEHEFIESNYKSETIDRYEHIVTCLQSKKPCGRLNIFYGSPGTGKTHLIRTLINRIKTNVLFCLVPPDMVAELVRPEFAKTLIGNVNTGLPIVLILEDADTCLKPRDSNLPAVSTLLNLTDGIFGDLINLKVIVTTNIENFEIDKALTRPGRICSHLHFNKLDRAQTQKIIVREIKKEVPLPDQELFSLAEAYELIRKNV